MSTQDLNRRINQRSNKILGIEHQTLIQCIQKFMRNRLHPFLVKDVIQYVYQNMGKYYQYQALYKIMKEEMSLSYKKCKPRPNSINLDEVKMRRVLFWTKFTKALKRGILIANTDESIKEEIH